MTERSKKKRGSAAMKSDNGLLFSFLSKKGADDDIVTLEDEESSEDESGVEHIVYGSEKDEDDTVGSRDDDGVLEHNLLHSPTPTSMADVIIDDHKFSSLSEDIATAEEENAKRIGQGVGIFWDLENCPVPKNISTAAFVGKIRARFCSSGAES